MNSTCLSFSSAIIDPFAAWAASMERHNTLEESLFPAIAKELGPKR
jgi:hypothetical protein